MAITASIGGSYYSGFRWEVDYDDATNAVTSYASGPGFCFVSVDVSNNVTRTIVYIPAAGAVSTQPDLARLAPTADFTVVSGTVTQQNPQTLATGVPANQVNRLTKGNEALGGLPFNATYAEH